MADFGLRSSGKSSVAGLADPSDSRPLSMRCLAHRKLGATWTNFPQSQPAVKPAWLCTPECLADVVAIVRSAERNQLHIHAFGSKWAFSDCAFDRTPSSPTCLIDTSRLKGITQVPGLSPYLWYVECGTTIKELYESLDPSSQALSTMGGASGQTIAGAVSTGTHGGDYKIPPIADSVLAIHLIGGAGVQYWIEPSGGIANPLPHAQFASGISPGNVIYNDDIFDSCLVSIGVMGVIYAFVLQARDQYPLVETTEVNTWQWVDTNFPQLLDPRGRFLQIAVSPYPNEDGTNTCLVTTRAEVPSAAGVCTIADSGPVMKELTSRLIDAAAGKNPVLTFLTGGISLAVVYANLAKISSGATVTAGQGLVDTINALVPDYRKTLMSEYVNFMKTVLPPGRTCSGKSYEVMDSNRRKVDKNEDPVPPPTPALSFEVFFPVETEKAAKASWVAYVSEVLRTIQTEENTFLVGYVSVRFMGKTRAILGMEQWNPTCSVEISVLGGVNNLPSLLGTLLSNSRKYGALEHWGQMLDKGVDANAYPNVGRWHAAYSEMNRRSDLRWFQTDLSRRSGLTP